MQGVGGWETEKLKHWCKQCDELWFAQQSANFLKALLREKQAEIQAGNLLVSRAKSNTCLSFVTALKADFVPQQHSNCF